MADMTKIKVVNVNGQKYKLSGDLQSICDELGITDDKFIELLDRDAYVPTIPNKPNENTKTYIDTFDNSECPFRIGQLCVYPEGISVLKSIKSDGSAEWMPITVPAINRVFDGGTPESKYGGSRQIDCGRI